MKSASYFDQAVKKDSLNISSNRPAHYDENRQDQPGSLWKDQGERNRKRADTEVQECIGQVFERHIECIFTGASCGLPVNFRQKERMQERTIQNEQNQDLYAECGSAVEALRHGREYGQVEYA